MVAGGSLPSPVIPETLSVQLVKRFFRAFISCIELSGLKLPFGYFCTFVLGPILDWCLDKENPPIIYEIQAKAVREIARDTGFQDFPLLLSERESCPCCKKLVLMLVQPENLCFECWAGITEESRIEPESAVS
jgi:hypothetical protein